MPMVFTINIGTRVKLVNGSHPGSGRLEVYHNGAWGSVCDNSFGVADALVVCQMLGFKDK